MVALETLQHLLAGRFFRYSLAEGRVHALQDSDVQQKVLHSKRQAPQDLFLHIIENKTLTTGKVLDRSRRIGLCAKGERCQLESRDPALCASS